MTISCKKAIDKWLSQIESQDIVIVVGAGFTKNALIHNTNMPASSKIPLWDDVINEVQKNIGVDSTDSLLLFDIYENYFGKPSYEKLLRGSIPDDSLSPSRAHECLSEMPCVKAIITTNNVDTLLDKTFPRAFIIKRDEDLTQIRDNRVNILYLHGHRNDPKTWIFSRTDYDELNSNYPLKTSFCRTLLAMYPSLFIGFGYSDQDIHSIMRYVKKNAKGYHPAMLSLAVNAVNEALIEYWGSLGLSIVNIHDETSGQEIAEELVEAMCYINECRIECLALNGKISPGFRHEPSFMESLSKQNFSCRQEKEQINLCAYHASRASAKIYRRLESSDIIDMSARTAFIVPNSETDKLLRKMHSGFIPAGSWGLMPSHRNWLSDSLRKFKVRDGEISIMLAGIAGLPHFIDTTDLILRATHNGDTNTIISLTAIDCCCGPLNSIKNFLEKGQFEENEENTVLFKNVLNAYESRRLKINLINTDILSSGDLGNLFFDVILSHHLASEYFINRDSRINRYAEVLSALLDKDGILVSAQNVEPSESEIMEFQKIMLNSGLVPLDTRSVFDIYDYSNKHVIYRDLGEYDLGIFVEKETLLTIHRRRA